MNDKHPQSGYLPELDRPLHWTQQAVCASVDPELFFPKPHTPDSAPNVQKALAICANCPVIDDCLEYALGDIELYGIWGGMTQMQRTHIRRYRRPA